ncbi:putative protein phosphatase 2C 22-like [Hibiscus syriacus]|uniref:tRNA (Cytosine(38)-C(5))-methyltransferase n=1 Tax=Hibiscus syriacus TaxID=106335 RepID=A0A6A2ZK85_HIBSY|nr:tRNA (cytosine(38)-C(5))-methyltransferase 2-like [Hibiscus syriacus]KAE8691345.1 putative protein phosphatase 2C 22-like [Hibiscus syriacus]
MAEIACQGTKDPCRVLEFYSGIGGMGYSLMKAGINYHVVQAFEINEKANDVYQHNFGHRPYQGNIQSLTEIDLDSYGANVWLLSPPCQPYTRQGLQKHSADARAFSFLNILELIPRTSKPPNMLLVENVVGIETSDTRAKMVDVLAKSDFVMQEFILSPVQFGVPYSRPRYFCLAKQKPLSFQCQLFNKQLLWSPSLLFGNDEKTMIGENGQSQENWNKLIDSCQPIEKFLEFTSSSDQVEMETVSLVNTDDSADDQETSDKFVEENACDFGSIDQFIVPLSLIERWGSAMDIVYPDSKRCCCFTKSYYRYVKGTGSLLAIVQPKKKGKTSSLKEQCLTYFTPREVANLHSFPKDFEFPKHISLRQRYAMLGNSLSVAVVARLLQYMFAEQS